MCQDLRLWHLCCSNCSGACCAKGLSHAPSSANHRLPHIVPVVSFNACCACLSQSGLAALDECVVPVVEHSAHPMRDREAIGLFAVPTELVQNSITAHAPILVGDVTGHSCTVLHGHDPVLSQRRCLSMVLRPDCIEQTAHAVLCPAVGSCITKCTWKFSLSEPSCAKHQRGTRMFWRSAALPKNIRSMRFQ